MFHLSSSLGSYNLFTDCLPRLPSKQHLSCSPRTTRRKTSSSTTPGPVISHDYTSSRLLLLLPCHCWSSGLTTRPVSTPTSLWNPWRPSSCRRVNVCQKVMRLRLLQWPLCGDWSQATPPSSRTKRCASSSWRPDYSPGKMFLPFEYGVATVRHCDARLKTCLRLTWGLACLVSCLSCLVSCLSLVDS